MQEDEVRSQLDSSLMVWLFSNIDKSIIGHATNYESSYEIWNELEQSFAQSSIARELQLKNQLNTLKKSSSIPNFVVKIMNIGAELKSIGQGVTDSGLIQSVLNRVGQEFDSVVVVISSQQKTISLQDAQYLLMMHEHRIARFNTVTTLNFSSTSIDFVSNSCEKKSSSNKFNDGRTSGGYRGSFTRRCHEGSRVEEMAVIEVQTRCSIRFVIELDIWLYSAIKGLIKIILVQIKHKLKTQVDSLRRQVSSSLVLNNL
ncbi:hypothetical protein Syun_006704 [Stephania yunnanensis]|uniref:Uncharacterized protein n=1 Tax=Stephania yunnanensis TaxID=152371 RepID=A0AAP0KX44_9MAGN